MREFVILYWVEFLFTSALGIMGYYLRKVASKYARDREQQVLLEEEDYRSQELIKSAVQAILRNDLIELYNFHMEEGYCKIHNRDNILNMYEQYHNLGVNGVMDSLVDEIMELPTSKPNK